MDPLPDFKPVKLKYDDVNTDQPYAGLAEAAVIFGVRKQVISNWRKRHPGFPRPVVTLALGPVWLTSALQAYKAKLDADASDFRASESFVGVEEPTESIMLDLVSGDHPIWKLRHTGDSFVSLYASSRKYSSATLRGEMRRVYAEAKQQIARLEAMYPFLVE